MGEKQTLADIAATIDTLNRVLHNGRLTDEVAVLVQAKILELIERI